MNEWIVRMTCFTMLAARRHGLANLFACLAILLSMPLQAEGWSMNDATIVYPLPQSAAELNQLLAPHDVGPGGALLPLKYWQRIPPINQGESSTRTYRNLRVVALRLDPCFKYLGDCLPQVRMVWQPIDRAVYGSASPFGLEAKDASVHTFHTMDAKVFGQFLEDYEQLLGAAVRNGGKLPLQVHPVIREQGLGGEFSRGLKALLLKYCGEQNLWRVTSMSTLVGGDKWEFRGFNIVDGKPVEIVIPRTGNARTQSFFVSRASDREYSNGLITPSPTGKDNINLLLRDSRFLANKDAAILKGLGGSVARIENPGIHNPESMDCVSCHSTQVAGSLLFGRIQWLSKDPQIIGQAFRSSPPLQYLAATQNMPRVFRALGYFEKSPVLSRRVINETAIAVGLLNEKHPLQVSLPVQGGGNASRSSPGGEVSSKLAAVSTDRKPGLTAASGRDL